MDLSKRIFLKILGSFLKIISFVFLFQAIISMYFGIMDKENIEFLYSTSFLLISQALYITGRKLEEIKADIIELKNRPYISFVLVPSIFLLLPFLGAIPFVISGESFLDAYFDSMSAFTTVGITIKPVEEFTRSLIFWRALEQWIGGIGILTFSILILSKSWVLKGFIETGLGEEITFGDLKRILKNTILFYLILTFLGFLLLKFSGMDEFHSLIFSMSGVSTGGMVPKIPLSTTQKTILMVLMATGLFGPFFFLSLLKDPIKRITEKRVLFLVSLILFVPLVIYFLEEGRISLLDSYFHYISATSTTGIFTIPVASLSHPSLFFLMVSMVIGGLVGSLTGGIKVDRVLLMFSGFKKSIKKLMGEEIEIDPREIISFSILLSYVILIVLGTVIFMGISESTMHAQFTSVSLILSGFAPVPAEKFDVMHKLFAIFFFWMGRLGIITGIAFFPSLYKLVKKR